MPPVLYWRNSSHATKMLNQEPFKSESEFEKVVFDTPAVLGQIYLLNRQVRGGNKTGIPDIIGIDSEGAVCIIEMKNVEVDATIIPQVLEYAIWAESNPDSIRALWLEADNRPDDIEVNWDEYPVRIVIVAPEIDPSTLEHVGKITYPVDLVEVTRWIQGKNNWLLVNKIEPSLAKRTRPVSALKEYNKEEYEKKRNPKSVVGFLKVCDLLQSSAIQNGWPVHPNFKKNYCAFKVGNHDVFGVYWRGTRSYALYFKVPESFSKRTRVPAVEFLEWDKKSGAALFAIEGERFKPNQFKGYIEKALEQRVAS